MTSKIKLSPFYTLSWYGTCEYDIFDFTSNYSWLFECARTNLHPHQLSSWFVQLWTRPKLNWTKLCKIMFLLEIPVLQHYTPVVLLCCWVCAPHAVTTRSPLLTPGAVNSSSLSWSERTYCVSINIFPLCLSCRVSMCSSVPTVLVLPVCHSYPLVPRFFWTGSSSIQLWWDKKRSWGHVLNMLRLDRLLFSCKILLCSWSVRLLQGNLVFIFSVTHANTCCGSLRSDNTTK